MSLLRYFFLNVLILSIIFSLNDASSPYSDKSASVEKSCEGYCSNNGICIMADNGPKCYCLSQWMGKRCDDIRKPASNGLFHSFNSAQPSPRGLTPCPADLSSACRNGATCFMVNLEFFVCSCPPGLGGDFCDVEICMYFLFWISKF